MKFISNLFNNSKKRKEMLDSVDAITAREASDIEKSSNLFRKIRFYGAAIFCVVCTGAYLLCTRPVNENETEIQNPAPVEEPVSGLETTIENSPVPATNLTAILPAANSTNAFEDAMTIDNIPYSGYRSNVLAYFSAFPQTNILLRKGDNVLDMEKRLLGKKAFAKYTEDTITDGICIDNHLPPFGLEKLPANQYAVLRYNPSEKHHLAHFHKKK